MSLEKQSTKKERKWLPEHLFDEWIFGPYLLLSIFGLIMIYSASSYLAFEIEQNSESYLIKQVIFLFVGVIAMFVVARFGQHVMKRKIAILTVGIVLLGLLIVVLFTESINGARSWITIAGFSLQPSEFVKIYVIWTGAYFYTKYQARIQEKWHFVKFPLAIVLGSCTMIMLQPDFGTTMIVLMIALFLLASTGFSKVYGIALAVLAVIGYSLTFLPSDVIKNFPLAGYQISRLLTFHDPWEDAAGSGYQVIQGFVGLARGGLTGTGLATSVQKTGFLPEAHTDFIMAIVGEELGFLSVLVVMAILFFLIVIIFLRAQQCESLFAKYLCTGVGLLFLIQSSINIGGLLGLAPITGVPLPFISYGGSSFLANSIGIGIVLYALSYDRMFRLQNNV